MNCDDFSRCISRGAQTYLRTFALACCMEMHRENGIEWICPKPGYPGPSLLYDVQLDTDMLSYPT